jgi:hypothetical protein
MEKLMLAPVWLFAACYLLLSVALFLLFAVCHRRSFAHAPRQS